jgi:galactokinase
MINLEELISVFTQRYGRRPRIFHAPGRVNLIGEHTDYNEGFVLPMAIDRGTAVAIDARPDRLLCVRSLDLNRTAWLNLDSLGSGRNGTWSDYVEGVASALADHGIRLSGADIALKSDVSIGGGLSSSAALEIAFGTAILSISGAFLEKRSLASAGKTAEHLHVGIKCGIMDQFTSVYARKDHAMLLDCRSLEAKPIPMKLDEYGIVVCDSRVRHSLASSEYNQRRGDCELGVRLLKDFLPGINSLRDVTASQLEAHRDLLPARVLRRCRHVIGENVRTLEAAEALSSGDLKAVGRLMNESHMSLREDYDVSCRELDILVRSAMAQDGVLGSRMTGGGFGGCTVNLVARENFEAFRENVAAQYVKETQIEPEIFLAEASDGAREMLPPDFPSRFHKPEVIA